MRLLRTAGVLLVALALASCSSGKKGATTSVVTTSSTVAVATAPTLPTIRFGSPEETIRHLFLEWQAGDRDAARQAATADAVTTLFSHPVGENKFRGCSHPGDKNLGSDCTYQYGQGLLQMHVSYTSDGNWIVTQVQFQT